MQQKHKVTSSPSVHQDNNLHTESGVQEIKQSILDNLHTHLAKTPHTATQRDWHTALSYTVRDHMIQQWITTTQSFTEDITIVAYLSSEFLLGPQLGNNLINLGIYDQFSQAAKQLGLHFDALCDQEQEPGLGNGGLGRLAACFMDSLATLEIPSIGYGVRYEFGSFRQGIQDGWQVEMTEKWLHQGNPWEIARPDITYTVCLGGSTESYYDEQDSFRVRWMPKFAIRGTAYDTPVSGYKVGTTNLLRLWKAEAVASFDFEAFKSGDYFSALNEKIASESIGKILYPDDEPYAGKQLRLAQQYFFTSCALQDMIRMHLLRWKSIDTFSNSFAVHLNDSHSAIAVAELIRLLVDEHLVNWDKAWYITQNTFSYTNHTTLLEGLEKWPLPLFAGILPRHLEIIYEINRRFLEEIWLKYPDNDVKATRLSLIDESDQKYLRMAHLASLGSHAITGVSEPHSDYLQKTLLADFYELYPERFLNVTNGVSPRRWMLLSNPRLSELITDTIGDIWVRKQDELKHLEPFATNPAFIKKWQEVRSRNKRELAEIIRDRTGFSIDPVTLFDVQMGRFHEYKRQHLTILHIITMYNRIKKNTQTESSPRTFIFGGKASPGYFKENLIIKLIHAIAEVINTDPEITGKLRVVFFPDFNVKNAQKIYPAADLSEQLTTAGREASGTGAMKFSLNGALTIGTLGGSNIEIRDEIGAENFFHFGLTAEEVFAMKSQGYDPLSYYNDNKQLKDALDLVGSGFFSKNDINLFKPFIDSLLCRDEHMVLADYQSYIDCQEQVSGLFSDQNIWAKMSILTVARMGKFSSDRSIREYNENIWHASSLSSNRTGT